MGTILAWIVIGGIAGFLASHLVDRHGFGLLGDIIVGIVGAFLAGLVMSLLFGSAFGITGFNLASLLVAFVGAVVLLFIVKAFTGNRAVRRPVRPY